MATNYVTPIKPVAPVQPKAPDYIGGAVKGIGGLLGGLIKKPTAPSTLPQPSLSSFPTLSSTGYPAAAPMGVQAKAPAQNIKGPMTVLPPAQTKTTPAPTSPTSQAQPAQNAGQGGITPNGTIIGADGGASNNAANNTGQGTNPNWQDAFTSHPLPNGATPTPYAVNGGLYGQLITGLANRSQQPGQQYTDAMGNYNQIADQIKQSQMNEAQAEANNRLNPIPIGDQTGREAVIRSQYGQQQTALSGRLQASSNVLGAANTQQGLLQQALQQAAAGAAPSQVTPGNYLQSPLGGGAQSAAEGQAQGFQAATNWAQAQQNIAQGRTYQGQAQDISNSLQLLQTIKPQLTSFMQEAGLNPQTAPILNEQINKIDAQANPAAYRTMNALVAEATSFVQQMLQSQGGMTPTDAGNLVASYHLDNLSPNQLSILLQNMEVAGNYRLSQAQSASQAGYGAAPQVGAVAQGADAQYGQLQAGGANQLNNLPDWLKILGGVGVTAAPAIGSAVERGVGGALMGGPAGAAAAVVMPNIAQQFFK